MPIRLLLVYDRGPIVGNDFASIAERVRARGIAVESFSNTGPPRPWSIFERMRASDIFPPSDVMVAAASVADVAAAKNAGAWAVGVTDVFVAPGSPAPTDDDRCRWRSLFLDAGADATVDAVAELADAIDAIDGLI